MRSSILLLVFLLTSCADEGGLSNVAPAPLSGNVADVLRDGTSFQLISLDPASGEEPNDTARFHGWEILGSTEVTDPKTRSDLIDALERGIAESDGAVAACFEPRHGIRVMHDGMQHDLVICFECLHASWYTEDMANEGFVLTDSPQRTFDRVLRNASVELP